MLQSYYLQDIIILEVCFFIFRSFKEMIDAKLVFELSAVAITNRFLLLGIWTCMASNKGTFVLAIDF